MLVEKHFVTGIDVFACTESSFHHSIGITHDFRLVSRMKLLEKLLHGLDVYKVCPTYEKPVGFFSSKIIYSEINEIFVTNHRLLMDTTDVYLKEPSPEKIKIGRIYAIERALLHYIAAHGSIFRYDDRKGPVVNGYIPPILSKQQLEANVKKSNQKLTEEMLNGILESLDSHWTEDFPSFRDLHNFLSNIFAKRHGIKASQVSPTKQNPKTFKSKSLRNLSDCDDDLELLLSLVDKIIKKISKNRFDVFEVHFGYNWQKIGLSEWYLNIDTFLSLRSGDIQSVLNAHATSKFDNAGSLHSKHAIGAIPVLPGFGTPITSTQASDKANSLEATFDLSTSSSSPSQTDNKVLNDEAKPDPKSKKAKTSRSENPKTDPSGSNSAQFSSPESENKENLGFKTPTRPKNDRVLRKRSGLGNNSKR